MAACFPFCFADAMPAEFPWLEGAALVAKPDQLVKRRGELGWERETLSSFENLTFGEQDW